MNKLSELDARVIDRVQNIYLWLWDRTGVFLATPIFILIVAEYLCLWPLKPRHFAFIAIMGAWSTWLYVAQGKSLAALNSISRSWRDFPLRQAFVAMSLALCVADAAKLDAAHVVSGMFHLIFLYAACAQVRDRDPKDFFNVRKLALQ